MATELQRAAPRAALRLCRVRGRGAEVAGPLPGVRRLEQPQRGRRPPDRADAAPHVAAAAATTPMEAVMAVPGTASTPPDRSRSTASSGGGIVPGSVVLLGGDPGIGKSTLALQVSHTPAATRCHRRCTAPARSRLSSLRCALGGSAAPAPGFACSSKSDVDTVIATIEAERPSLVVIDSVQTLRDAAHAGPARERLPGSGRGAPHERCGQDDRGARAAGRARHQGGRDRRAPHARAHGRRRAVPRGRAARRAPDAPRHQEPLRRHRRGGAPHAWSATACATLPRRAGACSTPPPSARRAASLTVTCDGLRPMAVEVQALAVASPFEFPRRTASGFELNRLHLMLAVLAKRAGIAFPKLDVFVNVAGGIRLADPGTDLAVALAIAGSAQQPGDLTPLRGDRRSSASAARSAACSRTEVRLAEAAAVGMEAVIVPGELSRRPCPAAFAVIASRNLIGGGCTTRVTVVSRRISARRSCGSIGRMHTHADRSIRRARTLSRIIGAGVGFVFGVLYGVFILSGTPGAC